MGFLQSFNENKVQIAAHDPRFEISLPSPRYPKQERGVCLVVGTHPCAQADVDAALLKYPSAKVCGVNEAGKLLPCDHIATCHGDKLDQFLSAHAQIWDDVAYPAPAAHIKAGSESENVKTPCYRWQHNLGGGSAIFAAGAMIAIGFDLVILCGCPIDGGGGYAMPTHAGTPQDPRLGELTAQSSMVQAWHMSIDQLVKDCPAIAGKIRSMSGFTKLKFGGIA